MIKKIGLGFLGLIALLLFAWFAFGGGVMTTQILLYKHVGVEPSGNDGTHRLVVAEEQMIEHQENTLPPEDFVIWKKAWDLKYKPDDWMKNNQELVKKIRNAENKRQKDKHDLKISDPDAYQNKYGDLYDAYLRKLKDRKQNN